jgi:hypothetical protein
MPGKKEKSTKSKEKASAPTAPKKVKEAKKEPEKSEPKVKAKAPVAKSPVPVLTVSFARWFAARSKVKKWKPHWMAGMKAYANTSGRKPYEEWDRIFKDY